MNISIEKFKDQELHDEWYPLYETGSTELKGKLHLILRWIYSKVKFFTPYKLFIFKKV